MPELHGPVPDTLRPPARRGRLDAGCATDVLWYFLGNSSYFTLSDELAWPSARTAEWLYEMLAYTLLGDAGVG